MLGSNVQPNGLSKKRSAHYTDFSHKKAGPIYEFDVWDLISCGNV
jgi:hypothetical protein